MKPEQNFYLAVSGAIPLLLIVLLAEGKLKFAKEPLFGQIAWVSMLATAIAGEVAALSALASGGGRSLGGKFCFGLSTLGLLLCLMMVMLLFGWQILGEVKSAGEESEGDESAQINELWLALPAAILVIGGALALTLPVY